MKSHRDGPAQQFASSLLIQNIGNHFHPLAGFTICLRRFIGARPRIARRGLLRIFVWMIAVMMGSLPVDLAAHNAYSALPTVRGVAQTPMVFALYYTWFDESTWSTDLLSDLPAQLYASRDRAVMGRHIEQAQAAGIDAFLVAWYGPATGSNQTEPNLQALLDEAALRNFQIGILFETDSPFFNGAGDITAALHHAAATHMAHPAYVRVDGRPPLFFWRQSALDPATWNDIRAQVDPVRSAIWISEGVETAYMGVFDGLYLYSNSWNPPADLTATNQKFAARVRSASAQFGAYKSWAATVMPGYDDLRIRPGNGFRTDREGGAYYDRAWQAALASAPDWIVITSFNEWPEGTYIEPSQNYGDTFLTQTARWSRQFKAGAVASVESVAPAPVVASAPAPVATDLPAPVSAPEPLTPTALVEVNLLNSRAGPGLEYEVIFILSENDALPILAHDPNRPQWLQVSAFGRSVWVSTDYVRIAGPQEDIPIAPFDPGPAPDALPAHRLPRELTLPEVLTYFP